MGSVGKIPRGKRSVTGAGRRKTPPEPRIRLDVNERRTQLVELGLQHFGERAYDDVSIDAIADSAGISKGLLYHYFPTKRAYYAATVKEAAERLLESTKLDGDALPLERLHSGLDAYLGYVRLHAKAYATLMRSGVGVDPEIARIVDETRRRFVERLTSGFSQGPMAGIPGVARDGEARGLLGSPLIRLALRGWVGFAEAACLEWTEAIAAHTPAPSQDEVRELLANALMEILRSAAVTTASKASKASKR
jgi:AcrR family transcriptional regulator